MAATPTSTPITPNPTLLYTNYRDVALKHFDALNGMYNQLLTLGCANSPKYKNLLYDAYYISGYILEAASVYIIFKNNKWDENIEIPAKGRNNYGPLILSSNFTDGIQHFHTSDAPSLQDALRLHNVWDYTKRQYTRIYGKVFFDERHNPSQIPRLLREWEADRRYYCEDEYETLFRTSGLKINIKKLKGIIDFLQKNIIPLI